MIILSKILVVNHPKQCENDQHLEQKYQTYSFYLEGLTPTITYEPTLLMNQNILIMDCLDLF